MYKTNLTVLSREILPNSTIMMEMLLFDNGIQRIEEGAFDHMTNLSCLYLQQNDFTRFPAGLFDALDTQSLQMLVLSCNLNALPALSTSLSKRIHCLSSAERVNITASNIEMTNVLRESAYQCTRSSDSKEEEYYCLPCPVGHVGRKYRYGFNYKLGPVCVRCPAGGFYQDEVGQQNCKKCVNGTFVSPNRIGTSPLSCHVFPTGTNTSQHAGFRGGPCLYNHYRLQRFGLCYLCDAPGANCTNEVLTVKSGFWWAMDSESRIEYSKFADNLRHGIVSDDYNKSTVNYSRVGLPPIHKCRRSKSCPGQNGDAGKEVCLTGSYGPLCELCNNSYFPSSNGCSKCRPKWQVGLDLGFGVASVLVLVFSLSWAQTVAKRKSRMRDSTATNCQSETQTGTWLDPIGAVLRIGIGFVQVMNGITTAVKSVSWPSGMETVGRYLTAIELNVLEVANPVCLNSRLRLNHLWKTVIFFSSVSVLLLLLAVVYWIWKVFNMLRGTAITTELHQAALQFCLSGTFWIIFACYPALSQYIIATVPIPSLSCMALNCTETSSPDCRWYLKADVSLECTQTNFHNFMWKLCNSFLVVPLGIPLIAWLLLKFKHRKIQRRHENGRSPFVKSLFSSLSFLDGSYNPKFWFWEVLEMFRKLILTSGLLFFGKGSAAELAVAAIVATGFAILHAYCKPMKESLKWEHRLQLLSLYVISINIMLGVVQVVMSNWSEYKLSNGGTNYNPDAGKAVFDVLFYVFNGVFVLLFIINIGKSIWGALRRWCCHGLSCSICCGCCCQRPKELTAIGEEERRPLVEDGGGSVQAED